MVQAALVFGAVLLFVVVPASAGADEAPRSLVLPTMVFAAGAAADWTSTFHALDDGCKEDNILINRFQKRPGVMIATGIGIDVAGAWAWNHYVGRNHPTLAKVGLYAAAAFRAYLAIRNVTAAREMRTLTARSARVR